MRRRLVTSLSFLACIALSAVSAVQASPPGDWTSWRGPAWDGTSSESGLVSKWSKEGENLLWKADFIGRSTPVVVGNRVCVGGRIGEGVDKQERVACYNAESGRLIWEHRFNVYQTTVPYNRVGWASPAADPETGNLYVHGVAGQLIAYEPDGDIAWEHFLTERFGHYSGYGGRTQTPLVEGNQLIIGFVCSLWGELAPLSHRYFSFDKKTGELLWISTPGGRPYDFNTQSAPFGATINGDRVIVTGNADGWIYGLRATTGEKLWGFQLSKRGLNSTPVVNGNVVFASHSEENVDDSKMGRVVAFKVEGSGAKASTSELWRINELSAGFPSPVYADGRLYVVDNSANMYAIDAASGKVQWDHSIGTVGKGSPVYADGKIYVTETNGHFHILRPGKEGVEVLDTEKLNVPDGRYAEIYGSPAVAGGRVFFTTEEGLYALGSKTAPASASKSSASTVVHPARGKGPAARIHVVPAEVLASPGETVQFTVQAFDGEGGPLGSQKAEWAVEGLSGEMNKDGRFIAGGNGVQTGKVVARVGGLTAVAPVRVVPGFPWSEDFESMPLDSMPGHWINAAGKFKVVERDGGRVLHKFPRERGLNRSTIYMGSADLSGYTIQADVLATREGRRVSDMGLVNNGYILDFKAAHQHVEVRSWPSELRMAKQVDLTFDPDTWYTMKMRVDVHKDRAVIHGKVWKRNEAEPKDWTITVEDPHPIASGSPGLVAYSPTDVYYDNIKVMENK